MLRCWLLQWFGKRECHVGSSYAWIWWSGPCTHACIGRVFITAGWLRETWTPHRRWGKIEKQKDKVQLYLGPNITRRWQSNACFALFCENMGGGVSRPFCITICLDPAMGAIRDSNLWKTAVFWLLISAMEWYGENIAKNVTVCILFFKKGQLGNEFIMGMSLV